MLNPIQTAVTTMFDAFRVSFSQCAVRVLGTGLLGLMLSAPLSWAQSGGVNPPQPQPLAPPQSSEIVFAASIITPEDGQVVDQDCFRLNTETGTFRAESLSKAGIPEGYWNVVSTCESTALFTAYMTAMGTTDDGQPVTVTISFVISDGTPLAYQVQAALSCTVSSAPSTGVRTFLSDAAIYRYRK